MGAEMCYFFTELYVIFTVPLVLISYILNFLLAIVYLTIPNSWAF